MCKNYFETTCTNGYKIGGISGKLPMDAFTPAVTLFKLGVSLPALEPIKV